MTGEQPSPLIKSTRILERSDGVEYPRPAYPDRLHVADRRYGQSPVRSDLDHLDGTRRRAHAVPQGFSLERRARSAGAADDPPSDPQRHLRVRPEVDEKARPLFLVQPGRDYRGEVVGACLLYTSDAADDLLCVDLGGR